MYMLYVYLQNSNWFRNLRKFFRNPLFSSSSWSSTFASTSSSLWWWKWGWWWCFWSSFKSLMDDSLHFDGIANSWSDPQFSPKLGLDCSSAMSMSFPYEILPTWSINRHGLKPWWWWWWQPWRPRRNVIGTDEANWRLIGRKVIMTSGSEIVSAVLTVVISEGLDSVVVRTWLDNFSLGRKIEGFESESSTADEPVTETSFSDRSERKRAWEKETKKKRRKVRVSFAMAMDAIAGNRGDWELGFKRFEGEKISGRWGRILSLTWLRI